MAARTYTEKGIQRRIQYWMGQEVPNAAISAVSDFVESDEQIESYPFIGGVPKMSEKMARGKAESLDAGTYQIINKEYESELIVPFRMRNRDKTGQVDQRIREFAQVVQSEHWLEMMVNAMDAGKSGGTLTTVDGTTLFSASHKQNPKASASDASNLTTPSATVTTAPTADEAATAIVEACSRIRTFRDDKGRPLNRTARNFVVFAPIALEPYLRRALVQQIIVTSGGGAAENPFNASGFSVDLVSEPYLDDKGWTDEFAVFRTDAPTKPFIRQSEWVRTKSLTAGSAADYYDDEWRYMVNASRAVGAANWQLACHVTLT